MREILVLLLAGIRIDFADDDTVIRYSHDD